MKVIYLIVFSVLFTLASAQNKVKKDTCRFNINMETDIKLKKMVLNTIDMAKENANDQPIMLAVAYIAKKYLGKKVELKESIIKNIFMEACHVNQYKLTLVEVRKHPSSDERFKGQFEVYLTYDKTNN